MTHTNDGSPQAKISPAFRARLLQLEPGQRVRAIVMLQTPGADVAPGRRRSPADRHAIREAIRQSAERALPDIDRILERFDGRRLAGGANALGSIPVESTAEGIAALASSEHITAILEDQPVSLLAGPGHE